jgi:hypothetical protein
MRRLLLPLAALLVLAACNPLAAMDDGPGISVTSAQVTQARAELPRLRAAAGETYVGYDRARFGQAWTDDYDGPWGHDGCDTRSQVLRRDAVAGSVSPAAGCKVRAGRWVSPYTGQTVTVRAKVQVDHIVPLGYAWSRGAYAWPAERRVQFANYPTNLAAVDASSNEGKGDSGPAEWAPDLRSAWCGYATRFTLVSAQFAVGITRDDRSALESMLRTCPA